MTPKKQPKQDSSTKCSPTPWTVKILNPVIVVILDAKGDRVFAFHQSDQTIINLNTIVVAVNAMAVSTLARITEIKNG